MAERVSVSIPDDEVYTIAELNQYCKDNAVNRSALIVKLIKEFINGSNSNRKNTDKS